MENHKHNKSQYGFLPYIPYEILVPILLRVPATSLTRFKAVSKSWHALLSSQEFIRAHLQINRADKKLIKYGYTPGLSCRNLQLFSLDSLLKDPITPSSSKMDDSYLDIGYDAWMMASCDGLICFFRKPNHIWIWNPATRKCRKLPILVTMKPGCLEFVGFGYYEPDNDYKLVAIHCPYDVDDDYYDDYCGFQVYSLNTHRWETAVKYCSSEIAIPSESTLSGVFLNNKPYWIENNSADCICYFDFVSSEFEAIETLPSPGVEVFDEQGLEVIDERLYLCYVLKTGVDLWLMKEDGKEYTWTKFVTINILSGSGLDVLHIFEKGEILTMETDKYGKRWLRVHDSEVCSQRMLAIPTVLTKAHIYVESLISI